MHHGYYGADGQRRVDHQQAQVDMIEALLEWGTAPDRVERFLDAGCGVGGSSRYLAGRYPGSAGVGVTLSPVQAAEGRGYNERAGLDKRLLIRAQDVYTLDPGDVGQFDLIWSMESAEHMRDKEGLFRKFGELLKPGGRLLMATWCHREEPPALTLRDQKILGKICDLYHLPPLVSLSELEQAAERAGLGRVRTDDWSRAVEPFWGAVIESGLDPRNWPGLIRSGMGTIRGAWAMKYMRDGFKHDTIVYGVLCANKTP